MEINFASPIQQYFEMLTKCKKRSNFRSAPGKKSKTNYSGSTDPAFLTTMNAIGRSALVWQENETYFDVEATTENDLGKYFKRRSEHREWSTVVDISIPLPSFKPDFIVVVTYLLLF